VKEKERIKENNQINVAINLDYFLHNVKVKVKI
jgi:hypothetical protein